MLALVQVNSLGRFLKGNSTFHCRGCSWAVHGVWEVLQAWGGLNFEGKSMFLSTKTLKKEPARSCCFTPVFWSIVKSSLK